MSAQSRSTPRPPLPDRTVVTALRFAPPGHFYSPHPRIDDVEINYDTIMENSRQPGGVDMNDEEQLELLARAITMPSIGPWHNEPDRNYRYYYENPYFRYGDGNALWQIAQLFRPKQVIEVGSGYSTACWLDTFDALELDTRITCIEPYPERLYELCRADDMKRRIDLRKLPVQQIPIELFRELSAGDVLFIDSTHVAKCGSDLNYLFFQVLPLVAPGVLVHLHDIFWPFDYPLDWYQEGRAWNECFLLRAFLQFNSAFRIVRFNSYLAQQHPAKLGVAEPRCVADAGASIWLQRNP